MRLASAGLFSWLEKNITVVTASRLQAAIAYRQFASDQLARGHETWIRPSVISLRAFLFRCWQEARYRSLGVPLLLSPEQEHLLWKNVITADRPSIFDASAAARLAAEAARLLAEWKIPDHTAEWPDRGDAKQFQRWLMQFREHCKANHWITLNDLWSLLPDWIERGWCANEQFTFLLANPKPASVADLQRALATRASCYTFDQATEPRIVPGKGFENAEAELDFAARWARAQLEAHAERSIAIVIPKAGARAGEIDRAFRDVFYCGYCRTLTDTRLAEMSATPAYNLLQPRSLREQPVVAGALLLLELMRDRVETGLAGAILRSPWIAGANEERSERAAADGELRRMRELDASLDDLLAASTRAPRLTKLLNQVGRVLEKKDELRPFSAWIRMIGDLLGALGWPSGEELQSSQQQAVESWKESLSKLGALSLVCEDVPFETAIAELQNLLDAPFERENALLSPVQILPPSAVNGVVFDAVLATGLGEDTWLPPHSTNPFVPLGLQRKHEVPGSSQLLLQRGRDRGLAQLLGAAPEVAATWSGRLSSAVTGFVSEKPLEPVWQNKATWQSYKPAILDELEDTQAPVYQASQGARGGTGIIKSQSLCPFRAFAEYRLSSQPGDEGCLGYDARDRGGHLHVVLEYIWKKLGSSLALKALSTTELEALVDEAARAAVDRVHPSPFGEIVHAVELLRLKEVTLDWLRMEVERLIPFTVETVEADRTVDLAGLRLKLRLDRMDRLPNGGLLLIDYKSGVQGRNKLRIPRPDEPQLLIYAAGIGTEVEGILFAQIRQRDVKVHGFARQKHFRNVRTVEALQAKWDPFIEESRQEVERLAVEFQSGWAAVDPKSRSAACAYCAQTAFCRINEKESMEGSEEE